MGWHIHLVKDTVEINSHIALDLYNCDAQVCSAWHDECDFPMLEGIINDGKLVFNPDHMEHMDYVWEPEVLEVLCKHRVRGDICFTSHDGDNAGESWGYRFDGEGGQVDLVRKDKGWEETGTCHPRGKGVLTCRDCGGTKQKLVPEGRHKLNVYRCAKCNSEDLDWVFPFPGGKYEKPVAEPKKRKIPAWRKKVQATVENEGFHYAFMSYSEFKNVQDKKFHRLREAYIKATKALAEHIGIDE